MQVAVVIPAYKPGTELLELVRELACTSIESTVVVDDGSGQKFGPLFKEIRSQARVTLLRHGVNLGKGSALKTGINHVFCNLPQYLGVVTADADARPPGNSRLKSFVRLACRHSQLNIRN